jgi:glutaconate CoA-transferase subunit B
MDSEEVYTADEMMTIAAARMVRNGAVCFVGIGLPSAASNLARRLDAKDAVLVYESGTIGAKPDILPLSIGDGELAETADSVVSTVEIFSYWLQGGRVDLGFLGAAQIDRFANINTTVIGDYNKPTVRLPGAGGAPEIAASCKEVLITLRQSKRTFVENLDFVTSSGRRVTAVITDLGILTPDAATGELMMSSIHPNITLDHVIDSTGWELKVAPQMTVTAPPTRRELIALRDLVERSRAG